MVFHAEETRFDARANPQARLVVVVRPKATSLDARSNLQA